MLVTLGKIYQKISPLFGWIDRLALLKSARPNKYIFILAPPRGGSTITYQVLATALDCVYFSNLTNVLYASPFFGASIMNKHEKNDSSFSSNMGFVQGLYGEAEGLTYWEYWANMSIRENEKPNKKGLKMLFDRLDRVNTGGKPFLFCYLPHLLYQKEIVEILGDRALFINLRRDTLSNAHSLYKASPNRIMSVQTVNTQIKQHKSVYEGIIHQLDELARRMRLTGKYSIDLSYENLCENTNIEITRIVTELEKRGLTVKSTLDNIPAQFRYKKINIDDSQHAKELFSAIEKLNKINLEYVDK